MLYTKLTVFFIIEQVLCENTPIWQREPKYPIGRGIVIPNIRTLTKTLRNYILISRTTETILILFKCKVFLDEGLNRFRGENAKKRNETLQHVKNVLIKPLATILSIFGSYQTLHGDFWDEGNSIL